MAIKKDSSKSFTHTNERPKTNPPEPRKYVGLETLTEAQSVVEARAKKFEIEKREARRERIGAAVICFASAILARGGDSLTTIDKERVSHLVALAKRVDDAVFGSEEF